MGKIKIIEIVLKATSALIASAMAIISFIGIIGRLKPKAV